MTDTTAPAPPAGFVRGSDRLAKALRDPGTAERVAAIREGMRHADVAHAAGIALIRQAAGRTQTQVAEALGTQQSAVSRMERGGDLLLSSLTSYIHAAGADAAELTVTIAGERITLDLDTLAAKSA